MPLADTPTNWPNGPSISTLHVLLLFAGVPLLVILSIFLLVMGPGWMRGARYRAGQPWEGPNEWFGAAVATAPQLETGEATSAEPESDGGSGGASAGW